MDAIKPDEQQMKGSVVESLKFDKEAFTKEEYEVFKDKTLINFLPTNRRVLLRAVQTEQKTKSGIYLPVTTPDKMDPHQRCVAMVVSCAADCRFWTDSQGNQIKGASINPGDFVLYSKNAETNFDLFGEQFIMVSDFDIHGKVPSNDEFLNNFIATNDPWVTLRSQMINKDDVNKVNKKK